MKPINSGLNRKMAREERILLIICVLYVAFLVAVVLSWALFCNVYQDYRLPTPSCPLEDFYAPLGVCEDERVELYLGWSPSAVKSILPYALLGSGLGFVAASIVILAWLWVRLMHQVPSWYMLLVHAVAVGGLLLLVLAAALGPFYPELIPGPTPLVFP